MLNRDSLAQVVKDFQEKDMPKLIHREIKISTEIPVKRAVVIIGPRRAGKTYLMFQIIETLLEKIEKERVLYVNLEDQRLFGATIEDLKNLLEVFYEIYPKNKTRKVYLFFDEIQNVSGWEHFVRSIIDSEDAQIFISGSSSKLLSKEIATSLRGRSITYNLYPFSFAEFLKSKNISVRKFFSSREKALVRNYLREYIEYGGYPEAAIFPQEREKILREILDVTLYRDIVERYKIKNIKVLKLLLKQLTLSSSFSVNKFSNFLKSQGISVSKNTLYNYLEYFNDSLVVFSLRKFSASYKEMEQTLPKIYFDDTGLLTISGVESRSKLMENVVFTELMRRGFAANEKLFYFFSQNKEVDFIVKNKKVEQLVQVCQNLDDLSTKEREVSALIKASKELKCKNLLVITDDYEAEEKTYGRKISYVPLWKWLLSVK